MPAEILDGQTLADKTSPKLAREVRGLASRGIRVCLGIVYIGKNAASEIYVARKQEAGKEVGIQVEVFSDRKREGIEISEIIPAEALKSPRSLRRWLGDLIKRRGDMSGIIVQLPLPQKVREARGQDKTQYILNAIPPDKDVDLLSTASEKTLRENRSLIIPPTIAGMVKLLERYDIPVEKKRVLVVGRGKLVGRPAASVFRNLGARVRSIDENTPEKQYALSLKAADIIITGIGKGTLIRGDMVGEGQTIIDAGTSKGGEGDVDFDSVAAKARYITPVPGGVGPMTVVMLLSNTMELAKLKHGI